MPTLLADGRVAVDMGAPRTDWRDIPLAGETGTLRADIAAGPLAGPVCTNMGNPHATFFVADADAVDLAALGPVSNTTSCFPSAPISASRPCIRRPHGERSGCASGSAAPASRAPAAAAPAPRWSPRIVAG